MKPEPDENDKTPIEQPTAKEWFEPGYIHRPDEPTNVVRRNFGPGLPARAEDDPVGPTETPPA